MPTGARRSVALACAVAVLSVGAPASAAEKRSTHTVVIEGVSYQPESLTVKRGETVVWVNKDPFPHTVTAQGAFDSGAIAANRSWRYTARKSGDYNYICTLHPNMKGTLRVE